MVKLLVFYILMIFLQLRGFKKIIDNFKKYDLDGIYGDLEYVEKINTKKVVRYWKSCNFNYKLLKKAGRHPIQHYFSKKVFT